MLDIFVYPVSGIMKLWHLLTHHFFDEQTAWLVSIVLLVLTVRSLIAPLTWYSVKAGRISALLRPRKAALPTATTPEEFQANQDAIDAMHKEHDYNPAIGCLPPLIMLPVFLGLYQVVLRMARPTFNGSIGFITAEEVDSFRDTMLNGVPIPAFISMPDSWATDLAVDPALVREKALPWLVLAIAFTVINLCISTTRSFWTTDFNSKLTRRVFILMLILIPFIPILLWSLAMNGPIPLAVIFYWFCTNLFTLSLTIVCQIALAKNYPLTDEVHNMRRESITDFREFRKLPSAEKKEHKAATKAENKKTAEIRREANKIRMAKRREERQAKLAQKKKAKTKGSAEEDENADVKDSDIQKTDD